MTYPLLLLALSLASPKPDEVKVYFGANAARSVPVAAGSLGSPFDIAHDKKANKLFFLTRLADGFHCLRLSLDGRKEADWKQSDDRRPICELHRSHGQLRTVLWEERRGGGFVSGPIFLASVPEVPSASVKFEEMNDWLAYDRSLAPDRVEPIRKLLVMLEFYPPMREAAGRPKNLDWVKVNARDLSTHMAWTPDFSVINYTWDMVIKTEVAIRKANGTYRVEDMQQPIKAR